MYLNGFVIIVLVMCRAHIATLRPNVLDAASSFTTFIAVTGRGWSAYQR